MRVIDLGSGKPQLRKPATCMYKRGFISAAPKESEDLWNSVENRLPAARGLPDRW